MKKFKFTINGNKYDVEITDIEENVAKLEVNGTQYEVELHEEVKKTKTPTIVRSAVQNKKEIEKNESKAGSKIKAPLPGTILKVNVKVGDEVKKGDVLMVMEAMKMENNVLAETGGTIKALEVKEGDSCLQGDTLVEIG
jgi:biotin carboxyl carrier protein